jgi:hypothetical protein
LIHRAGGAGGATWVIDYDESSSDDDEPGYRLDIHSFVPGEYVTIREQDGAQTFRVEAVKPEPHKASGRAAASA